MIGLGPGEGTWTCHVCDEERPDAKIAVLTLEMWPPDWPRNWPPIKQNVRFCVDRPACIEGAKSVNFFKEDAQ